jgi:hypothetical protein
MSIMKEDLKGRGRERFNELLELKDLMRKRRIAI